MENIIEILETNSLNRNNKEKLVLYSFFQKYKFFAELNSSDESGATLKSCINSLVLEKPSADTTLPSGIYILLAGSAKYINPKPEKLPKFIKFHLELNPSQDFKEFSFGPGTIFGQLKKSENYGLTISENCVFAVLSNDVYYNIVKTQEDIQLEKIEFLKSLEIFKSWGRKAVKKAAKAFEKIEYRKGAIVYKESDVPDNIYLVKEGEFKLTQDYVVGFDNKEKKYEFGSSKLFKYSNIKPLAKRANLQIILKQKGEIFGHNEFMSKIAKREFSALCNSNHAIVYVISEKEFFKKFNHPETLRILEEQNSLFSVWKSNRLINLKSIESFKVKFNHTPVSPGKSSRGETPMPLLRKKSIDRSRFTRLPKIISKFIDQKAGREEKSVNCFKTELSVDYYKRKSKF